MRCFGRDPKDLRGTAAAAAEGGRDTRVLGDPMDLIRCQSYLAEHGGTQTNKAQTRHTRQKVRQDGEKLMIREKKESQLFFLPQRSLDYYWLINIYAIYFRTNAFKKVIGNALILHSRIKPRNEDKASIYVYVDTPYMSGMVYASTVPPVVGISYLMWYRYTN